MGWRSNDDEPGGALRIIQSEGQREQAAPGMADHNGAAYVEPIEHGVQHRRLIGG